MSFFLTRSLAALASYSIIKCDLLFLPKIVIYSLWLYLYVVVILFVVYLFCVFFSVPFVLFWFGCHRGRCRRRSRFLFGLFMYVQCFFCFFSFCYFIILKRDWVNVFIFRIHSPRSMYSLLFVILVIYTTKFHSLLVQFDYGYEWASEQ